MIQERLTINKLKLSPYHVPLDTRKGSQTTKTQNHKKTLLWYKMSGCWNNISNIVLEYLF